MKSMEEIYEELSGLIRECRWEEIESFLQTCMDEAKDHDVAMAWHRNNYNPAIALFMEMLEAAVSQGML